MKKRKDFINILHNNICCVPKIKRLNYIYLIHNIFLFTVQKRPRIGCQNDQNSSNSPVRTPPTPRAPSPNTDNELNVEEEDDDNSNQSSVGAPENLSLKGTRSNQFDDMIMPVKKESQPLDKWPQMDESTYISASSPNSKYIRQIDSFPTPREDHERKMSREHSSSSDTPTEIIGQQNTAGESDHGSSDHANDTQLDNSFESGKVSPQYSTSPCSRSPIDVLMRVFPGRRRSEIENLLSKCKGDVVLAMEAMLSGGAANALLGSQLSYAMNQDSPPYSLSSYQTKSAFSPLGGQTLKFSPSRRFLTPPYSGTGYLPTVIRPPADYLAGFLPPGPDVLSRRVRGSPPSPRSDHTNADGYSD